MQPNLHRATPRPIVMPPRQFCAILVLSKEPAAAADARAAVQVYCNAVPPCLTPETSSPKSSSSGFLWLQVPRAAAAGARHAVQLPPRPSHQILVFQEYPLLLHVIFLPGEHIPSNSVLLHVCCNLLLLHVFACFCLPLVSCDRNTFLNKLLFAS